MQVKVSRELFIFELSGFDGKLLGKTEIHQEFSKIRLRIIEGNNLLIETNNEFNMNILRQKSNLSKVFLSDS